MITQPKGTSFRIVEENGVRRIVSVMPDGKTSDEIATLPKHLRSQALREMDSDPWTLPSPDAFVVLSSSCVRCGDETRHCDRTEATDAPDEPCFGGLPHEWRYRGRSIVTGSAPWKGNVPGQRKPGLHALREGQRVHVGPRSFVAPSDGVFELQAPDRPWSPVRSGDFTPTGDGGFIRRRPLTRADVTPEPPGEQAPPWRKGPNPNRAQRRAEQVAAIRERRRQAREG